MTAMFTHSSMILLSDNPPLPLAGTYFITGTDTEVGKTTVTCELIRQLSQQGKRCYAIKPVTAGTNALGLSEDAERINEFASINLPLTTTAPILLQTPCSPHIASHIDGVELQAGTIIDQTYQTLKDHPADCVLVEGAGGWFTPINAKEMCSETLAEVARGLEFPIILVVGLKLGCLNHAVLTLQAIWHSGAKVAMVVFNQLNADIPFMTEQMDWLQDYVALSLDKKNGCQNDMPVFAFNPFLS